jgi:chromosome segregation ATPase
MPHNFQSDNNKKVGSKQLAFKKISNVVVQTDALKTRVQELDAKQNDVGANQEVLNNHNKELQAKIETIKGDIFELQRTAQQETKAYNAKLKEAAQTLQGGTEKLEVIMEAEKNKVDANLAVISEHIGELHLKLQEVVSEKKGTQEKIEALAKQTEKNAECAKAGANSASVFAADAKAAAERSEAAAQEASLRIENERVENEKFAEEIEAQLTKVIEEFNEQNARKLDEFEQAAIRSEVEKSSEELAEARKATRVAVNMEAVKEIQHKLNLIKLAKGSSEEVAIAELKLNEAKLELKFAKRSSPSASLPTPAIATPKPKAEALDGHFKKAATTPTERPILALYNPNQLPPTPVSPSSY